jgi:hypothetical protein
VESEETEEAFEKASKMVQDESKNPKSVRPVKR